MIAAYGKPNAPFALSVAKGLMIEESDPSLRSGRTGLTNGQGMCRTGQRVWQTLKGRGKRSRDLVNWEMVAAYFTDRPFR